MIRAIAIDDEPRALKVVEAHAARVDFLQLRASFTNPLQALSFLDKEKVDLVFLDIDMPDMAGFDWLEQLREPPQVILTTAHSRYALQGYEVEAVDFLLKPFDFPRFLKAVRRVRERLQGPSSREFFFVSTGARQERIFFQDIHFIRGEGNYVAYHTENGKLLVRAGVQETLALLPPADFVQIHRSTIVALRHMERVEDRQVVVKGQRLPVSATYWAEFLRRLG